MVLKHGLVCFLVMLVTIIAWSLLYVDVCTKGPALGSPGSNLTQLVTTYFTSDSSSTRVGRQWQWVVPDDALLNETGRNSWNHRTPCYDLRALWDRLYGVWGPLCLARKSPHESLNDCLHTRAVMRRDKVPCDLLQSAGGWSHDRTDPGLVEAKRGSHLLREYPVRCVVSSAKRVVPNQTPAWHKSLKTRTVVTWLLTLVSCVCSLTQMLPTVMPGTPWWSAQTLVFSVSRVIFAAQENNVASKALHGSDCRLSVGFHPLFLHVEFGSHPTLYRAHSEDSSWGTVEHICSSTTL